MDKVAIKVKRKKVKIQRVIAWKDTDVVVFAVTRCLLETVDEFALANTLGTSGTLHQHRSLTKGVGVANTVVSRLFSRAAEVRT